MADIQFLREADWTLSSCGQSMPPAENINIVYRLKNFLVQTTVPPAFQPGSTQTFTKLITGDTTWELKPTGLAGRWCFSRSSCPMAATSRTS